MTCDLSRPQALPIAVLTFLIVALMSYYCLHLNTNRRAAARKAAAPAAPAACAPPAAAPQR